MIHAWSVVLALGVGLGGAAWWDHRPGKPGYRPLARSGRWLVGSAIGAWATIIVLLFVLSAGATGVACTAHECSDTVYVVARGPADTVGLRVNTPATAAGKAQLRTLVALWRQAVASQVWNEGLGSGRTTATPLLTVNEFPFEGGHGLQVVVLARPSWRALIADQPAGFSANTWIQLLTAPSVMALSQVERRLPPAWQRAPFGAALDFDAPYGTVHAVLVDVRPRSGASGATVGRTLAGADVWTSPARIAQLPSLSAWQIGQVWQVTDGPCALADVFAGRRICTPRTL